MGEHHSNAAPVITTLTPDRFEEQAAVHSLTWRQTYRGMLPDWLVDKITPEFALSIMKQNDPKLTLIALEDDRIVGFVEYIPEARANITIPGVSEIAAIYVLADHQHRGIGRQLMQAALEAIPHRYAALSAFEGNARAFGFYEHLGFHKTGATFEEDDGASREVEMTNKPKPL